MGRGGTAYTNNTRWAHAARNRNLERRNLMRSYFFAPTTGLTLFRLGDITFETEQNVRLPQKTHQSSELHKQNHILDRDAKVRSFWEVELLWVRAEVALNVRYIQRASCVLLLLLRLLSFLPDRCHWSCLHTKRRCLLLTHVNRHSSCTLCLLRLRDHESGTALVDHFLAFSGRRCGRRTGSLHSWERLNATNQQLLPQNLSSRSVLANVQQLSRRAPSRFSSHSVAGACFSSPSSSGR